MFGLGWSWRRGSGDDVRFSTEFRVVLQRAREEALKLPTGQASTEHLLLAMLGMPDSEAGGLLRALGARGPELRERLERVLRTKSAGKPEGRQPPDGEMPWTSKAKRVIEAAIDRGRELTEGSVDSSHLLLGLLDDPSSVAGTLLREHGIRLGPALALIERGTSAPAELRIEIDDRSDQLVYKQIVLQTQEAIATGQVRPGQRLPPIRQLADQLEIAPGTVARAYAELESGGVVGTEGPRGTFVSNPQKSGSKPASPVIVRDLLRPAVVAAFHLGATAAEVRSALEQAMEGIYD